MQGIRGYIFSKCIFSLRKDLRFVWLYVQFDRDNSFPRNTVGITKLWLPGTYMHRSIVCFVHGRCKTMGQILFMRYNRCEHTPCRTRREGTGHFDDFEITFTHGQGRLQVLSIAKAISLPDSPKKTIVNYSMLILIVVLGSPALTDLSVIPGFKKFNLTKTSTLSKCV